MLIVGLALAAPSFAQEATERDLIRTRPDDDQRPWLMMNTGGHTANVQSLAFSPDGKRLYSAGLDKVVNVWDITAALRDLRRTYLLERSLRWQIGRSLRGGVYALAVAPNDGLLAVGGYGASPGLGEIVLFDPVQNRLVKPLEGHRQAVASLAFNADGAVLASVDLEGRALLWKRGDWSSTVLSPPDREVYGDQQAATIQLHPKLRPVAIVKLADGDHVLLPAFAGVDANNRLQWKLRKQSVANPQQSETFDTIHLNLLSAVAASADGKRFATADGAGNLYLWETGPPVAVATLVPGRMVLSLAFTPDGKTLIAGTTADAQNQSELQLWDVATRQITSRRPLNNHVFACAISSDGNSIATSGGLHHEVFVGRTDALANSIPLRGQGRRVAKVAFHKQDPYRIGFGTRVVQPAFNNYGPIERSFDPVAVELAGEQANPDDWLPVENPKGTWELRQRNDARLQLFHNGQAAGIISLDQRLEGRARCFCWLANEQGEPLAVAVGTDVQNSVYVFGLAEQGDCPIWRHYRGHNDIVTSVGVSRDGKYLVSGSSDGTVRLWSLAEIEKGPTLVSRWGVEWAVDNGALKATRVHPAGPLFFNGVRQTDTLKQIEWLVNGRELHQIESADAKLQRLNDLPFGTQVDFFAARGDTALPPFPRLPAWQPLATLFVAANDEWAFWTPEGYYDASANGHTLFGWHVNRGLTKLPDFYRADQFQRRLERPDIMERLLEAGSLSEAFKLAAAAPPPPADQAVQQQIAATPRVDILSPVAGTTLDGRATKVRARIELPQKGELTEARVFAGGVAARGQRIIDQQQADGQRTVTYEWDAQLPSEQRNLIQVLANTAEQAVGVGSVIVEQSAVAPTRAAKLYLLAVGMNEYRDPAVQPLAFSVADAQSVVQLFQARTSSLFQLEPPTVLLNEKVTPAQWRETFARLREQLADAQPDDLLVIFLAGHGFVDPVSGRYYFAGYDISKEDYLRGVYTSSIAWSDFQLLADVPCRKLALLDTCHSGAIQPLRWRNLKSAVRTFQQDLILTVTASAGHEKSEEKAEWQHGAFTKTLLEGLEGNADGTGGDGVVSLPELVDYVKRAVPELTAGRQNPTAGPVDLLPYVSLRLSKAK